MAFDSWLSPTPLSGTGNGVISNTASQHTGRVARTTIVTVTPSVGDAKTYTVNQTASPEFITVPGTASVGATATTYTISGQSNSSKINWTVSTAGTLNPSVPASYTANGSTATNNVNIPNDPGAKSQFDFSGVISFTANPTISIRTGTITLTAGAGGTGLVKTITFTQAAGASTLSISPTSATYSQSGEGKTVSVTTNSTWSSSPNVKWLSVSPSTGGAINTTITATQHTGRANRSGVVTFTVTNGGTKTAEFNVTQTAKAEFVSWNQSSYVATKNGGTVNMRGSSNSSKLTFTLKAGGSIDAAIPTTYLVYATPINNGDNILSDPGSKAQFNFSIDITIPSNLTIDSKSCVIVVTPSTGTAAEATITQAGGDVVLSVSPESIILPASGTASGDEGKINVTSNTSWTVS